MKLNTMSYAEALEHVSDLLIKADALVVDMRSAPGYPSLMVLVKDCMPLFIFVKPDWKLDDETWKAAKTIVTRKLWDVGATWFDIDDTADMDWLLGEIMKRTKGGEIKKLEDSLPQTAEQQGFEFDSRKDECSPVGKKAWLT